MDLNSNSVNAQERSLCHLSTSYKKWEIYFPTEYKKPIHLLDTVDGRGYKLTICWIVMLEAAIYCKYCLACQHWLCLHVCLRGWLVCLLLGSLCLHFNRLLIYTSVCDFKMAFFSNIECQEGCQQKGACFVLYFPLLSASIRPEWFLTGP